VSKEFLGLVEKARATKQYTTHNKHHRKEKPDENKSLLYPRFQRQSLQYTVL
jgi:hypothetical protein